MSSQGPQAGSTAADNSSVGTIVWSVPARALVDDGSYAQATLSSHAVSHYLVVTGFDFSAIPAGATINGISATMKGRLSVATSREVDITSVRMVKRGTISGSDLADSAAVTTAADANYSYGGSSALWGLSWTDSDLKDSTTGIAFSFSNATTNSTAMQVNFISLTVNYTASSGPPQNIAFFAYFQN